MQVCAIITTFAVEMRRLITIIVAAVVAVMSANFLVATPATTLLLVATAGSTANAYGGNGHIVLSAGGQEVTFSIYSITGQLIKSVKVNADQRVSVEMPKGFYVVKCAGQWSRKVVVK